MNCIHPRQTLRPLALAVMLSLSAGVVHADERESMEVLKQTTLNLINALVENGVLTREKANELIRTAEEKAARTVALSDPKPEAGGGGGAAAGVVAGTAVAGAAAGTAAAPAPVRVQYIPESTKKEIRDQIRKDVLAQAREEHWADPNVIPSWLDRIKVSGDVLARYQFEDFASNNTAPRDYDQSNNSTPGVMTRNAPLADSGFSSGNTQNDVGSERLRVRLGIDAKLSDAVRTEVRIATGSTDSRVSTTQPLGSAFNKYSLWLDRGFIAYDPAQWMGVKVGRMSNPFVGSDLMWDDNLNFDGLTLNFRDKKADGFVPYATLGAFPLSIESSPAKPYGRTLFAVQAGAATDVSTKTRARFGLAYYNFHNLEGHVESEDNYLTGAGALTPTYANTEYQAGMRQKGNTLVRINAANDSSATIWGLSSRFKPIHFGFGIDNARTDAMHLIFSADYVKNLAYDRSEIQTRTGVAPTDGSSSGYQIKFLTGAPVVRRKGEWNASVAFRNLGSDAVPDAFVDGTLGGGGTNLRGYILGFNYGLDLATTFGVRYMAARNIDSPSMVSDTHTYKQNTLQLDLGVGF
jgi:hypothetical protein